MSKAQIVALGLCLGLCGCSLLPRSQPKENSTAVSSATGASKPRGDIAKVTRLATEMLDPTSSRYNPEKGRVYLEYALRQGGVRRVELNAPAMLELLKSERVAAERSRSLEQQLEIMKEIDLNREEAL